MISLSLSSLLFLSFLAISISPSSAQTSLSISADNTFALYIDGSSLTALCPDSDITTSPSPSTPSNCAWPVTSTYDLQNTLHAFSLLALEIHNAFGVNTNPLTGGTNPAAFIYSLVINSTVCSAFLPFTCIDDLQSQTLYGSTSPPSDWYSDPFFDESRWTFNSLSDLGANTAQAWTVFGTPASTLYGGDSIWYHTAGHANPNLPSTAHWQWYRPQAANTNLFCRVLIPERGGCPLKHSPRSSHSNRPSQSFRPSRSNLPIFPSTAPGECCCDALRNEQGVLLHEARVLREKVGNITRDLDLLDRLDEDIEALLDLPRLLKAVERLIGRSGGGSDDDDGHHFGKKDITL